MKKLFFCIVLMFTVQGATTANGQSYYANSGLIEGDGFTLKCFNDEGLFTYLYSPNNVLMNTPNRNKDGSYMDEAVLMGVVPVAYHDEWENAWDEIMVYCNGSFSFLEKLRLRNDLLGISMRIYVDTTDDPGSVKEVVIELRNKESAINISPAKYYQLIQWIKQNLRFQLTEAGANLNYVLVVMSYDGKP